MTEKEKKHRDIEYQIGSLADGMDWLYRAIRRAIRRVWLLLIFLWAVRLFQYRRYCSWKDDWFLGILGQGSHYLFALIVRHGDDGDSFSAEWTLILGFFYRRKWLKTKGMQEAMT